MHAMHLRGVTEGKQTVECLGNFNSKAEKQNLENSLLVLPQLLLLLLLFYLNMCMTERPKDDCS